MDKAEADWHLGFCLQCVQIETGQRCFPDNSSKDITFGDYREKDLAKWAWKQICDQSTFSSPLLLVVS